MSRRIEVELTSARPDGTWTWRAAGAREPKGVVEGSILPPSAKVGDVLRVDADMDVDGISILAVLPPKGARKEPERLEIIGSERTFEPVTSTLVDKRDRPRRDRSDRPPRREGEGGDRRERRDRPPKRDGDPATADRAPRPPRQQREPKERRERPPRPPVPMLPERPKPKRLKPGRTHRKAILDSLPDEQRAVAEQVLRGGVPAVREALKEQNEKLKAEGQPPIKSEGVVSLAEDLLPRLRVAEWLDRAEAALADLDELDLRDLRSVVAASGDSVVARDESTRELAEKLRDGLSVRQDKEHQEWLADIDAALGVGRVVRALRLSSRPPKAGVRFPTELGTRLAEAAGAALAADAAPDRWGAVLEAVAYSPVRASVTPAGYPATVTDELTALVKPLAGQVPEIAKHFGIEPPPPGARAPRQVRRPAGPRKPKPPPPPPRNGQGRQAAGRGEGTGRHRGRCAGGGRRRGPRHGRAAEGRRSHRGGARADRGRRHRSTDTRSVDRGRRCGHRDPGRGGRGGRRRTGRDIARRGRRGTRRGPCRDRSTGFGSPGRRRDDERAGSRARSGRSHDERGAS